MAKFGSINFGCDVPGWRALDTMQSLYDVIVAGMDLDIHMICARVVPQIPVFQIGMKLELGARTFRIPMKVSSFVDFCGKLNKVVADKSFDMSGKKIFVMIDGKEVSLASLEAASLNDLLDVEKKNIHIKIKKAS